MPRFFFCYCFFSQTWLFLHRWGYCWKCEFDAHVKIEYCFTMMKSRFLLKSTYQNTEQKKGCSYKKTSNAIWRKLTSMNRNWTGKLQVTLLSAYISWKKLCSNTFKTPPEGVIRTYSEKMKAKYMRYMNAWVFCINLQVGISQLHYRLTSSQIIFWDFKSMNAFV